MSEELQMALTQPVLYRGTKGGAIANGVRAEALPQICEVWLKARDAGKLVPSQERITQAAEILMHGLAHTGIIALSRPASLRRPWINTSCGYVEGIYGING
jgi:hypothetical protein